jgi:Holliday junction DNA helicase RuvA
MIGKLKGILEIVLDDRIIIDVSGVGYIVYCSSKTLSALPNIGEQVSFLINMQVKEDDISLYGFMDQHEQEWFNNLITVQGIGPRLALTVLSFLDPNSLVAAIIERSKETFKHISGVGPKLAERIFTELSKKAENYSSKNPGAINKHSSSSETSANINDALIALTNLGYARGEAFNVCKTICQDKPDITINDLIRLALKQLSK